MRNGKVFRNSATIIAGSLAAGQTGSILSLGRRSLPDRAERDLIKRIKADEGLSWANGATTTANGVTVPGFAIWNGTQATNVCEYTHRHRLLALCRPDTCYLYAVPVGMLGRKIVLPDLDLADFELEAYQCIADRITPTCAEYTQELLHPAKPAIKSNRAEWRDDFLNAEALGQLLKRHAGWIFPLIAATLDAQFRSFAACADVPICCYNFTARRPSMQVEQTMRSVLGALNFTVQGEYCCSSPVEISVQDARDLNDWAGCLDRIVLLRTATGAPLHPLFDKLDESIRQSNFGGVLPPRLATVPIIRSRTFFGRADTIDVELPSVIEPLSDWELDLLRIAAARTITKANIVEAHRRWHGAMRSQARYRLNSFKEWRRAIVKVFLEANLPSHGTAFDDAYGGWESAQKSQFEAEADREDKMQKALALLSDQSQYEAEIIPKPSSFEEAVCLLDEDKTAVAFRHAPTQGSDKGQRFVVFSNSSMLRLLQRAGLRPELYEMFKKRASEVGLLVKQSRPVKLGDHTFNGFWIIDQKF